MPKDEEVLEKVTVDKKQVREEIGQSPGLPKDTYGFSTHTTNAERIYGVPEYVVHGALSYLQQTDPDNYDPDKLTIDQVRKALDKYQAQEYRS